LQSYDEDTEFQFDRVNYRRIDTLGATDVYVYTPSPMPGATYFQVSFSFVGKGNGNYTPTTSSANGRVYTYEVPVSGVSIGEYEAIVLLVSPVQQQLLTAATTYKSKKGFSLNFELAGSSLDKNTFSVKDSKDDNGWAGAITLKNITKLFNRDTSLKLETTGKYEHKNKHFNFVERYRPVEFSRQWNRQLGNPLENSQVTDEDIFFLDNNLVQGSELKVNSKFYYFLRKDIFNGFSHELSFAKSLKTFEIYGTQGITKSKSLVGFKEQNDFVNYGLEVAKFIKQAKVGVGYSLQESQFSYDSSKNIGAKSFGYNTRYAYLNFPYKESNIIEVRGELRKDKRPLLTDFKETSLSQNLGVHLLNNSDKKNRIEVDLTYRSYEVLDSSNFPGESEDNLLSKLQYNFRWFKNSIKGNTFLNVGTGREQRREYTYLEVQAGRGFYVWNDYNNNGIKELNEFEESIFQDQANYIRIITPTNEFIKSNTNAFNQTLKIQGPKTWSKIGGLRKFLFRFSTSSAWRISRKNTKNDFFALVNPFENNIESENLIYTKFFVKHTLFFNRLSSKYSLEYTNCLIKIRP